jgi:hypothetical protein
MRHRASNSERQVTELTAREADDAHHSTGPQQITNASQPGACIDMMQSGHRRDKVEGRRLKRIRKEVAQEISNTTLVVLSLG